jgi:Ca2+-binding RTX toxin-like protein
MSYSSIDSLLSQEIALSESDSEFLVKDNTTLVNFSSIAAEINTEEVSTITVDQVELSIDLQQDLPSSLFNSSSQLSARSIESFSYQPIFSAEQVDQQAHDDEEDHDHFDPYPISDVDGVAAGTITDNANPSTPTILSNFNLSNVFNLHSNPNAKHTIYLDFDGHTTENTWWNNTSRPTIISSAYDTNGDASTFSNAEMKEIVEIWQRVAEDFAPFEVNVTTEAPNIEDLRNSGAGDTRWGIRTLMTQNINAVDNTVLFAGAGGIAYMDSFNLSSDTPVFAFNKGVNNAAMTVSHEIGHSLGLRHDGQVDSNPNDTIDDAKSYHLGFGSGSTSWGTLMGAPFNQNLTQWSKGDYQYANNQQDDLAVITTQNGFGYRVDDYGDNLNTATRLSADASNKISAFGLIERNTDKDVFSFVTGAGSVLLNLNVAAASRSYISDANSNFNVQYLNTQDTNLDLWAGIYSSDGTLVAQSNPTDLLSANFTNLFLTTGLYYLQIDGVGKDGTDGYSDYGSLGQYSINSNLTSVNEVNGDSSNNTLYGSINSDYIQGFAGDDILRDNLGDDTLMGGEGNDDLYAGQGNDILQGGNGNDTYYLSVDSTDLTNDKILGETSGGGTDTAYAIFSVDVLADNVENLILTGTANINATGNSANNTISGNSGNNSLTGGAGDDSLFGGAGNDSLTGGAGDDSLAGDAGDDLLRDSLGADTLIGGDGNDNLYAGQGNDILQGGNGNDTYYLSIDNTDLTNDLISGETADGGTDTAYALFSVDALTDNIENLILTGTANINATGNSANNTISGNSGNNSLVGGAGNDSLTGGAGDDALAGDAGDDLLRDNLGADILMGGEGNDDLYAGQGNDILQGGNGNDTYYLSKESTDLTNDVISGEMADGGTDTAYAIFSVDALADNVENLILTGTANINATGNSGNNTISGNNGSNSLAGGAGDDSLAGGAGNDILRDNLGADILMGGDGNDDLYGGQGNDILQGGNGNDTYYLSIDSTDLTNDVISGETTAGGTDTAYAIFSVDALTDNIENLILTGTANINGTGNSANNTISGNSGNNALVGGAGNDSLTGGAGDDALAGDAGDDLLRDNLGADTLIGGEGNDNLYAGQGNDILQGGNGNDTYYLSIDSTDLTNDTILGETASGGTDIAYAIFSVDALAENVENLTLTGTANINGTGNSSNNTISGNSGNNSLVGGAGNDYLAGGAGDDILRDSLGADTLMGGDGNDDLYGGQGNDILQGGNGNDTYYLSIDSTDLTNDLISGETVGGGTDTAYAIFSVAALATNVENLTLTGTANIDGFGNSQDNTISGNGGNNILNGAGGVDNLFGGGGNDTYIVSRTLGGGTIIDDASGANDTLSLSGNPVTTSEISRNGTTLLIDLNQNSVFDPTSDLSIKNFFASTISNNAGSGFIENVGGLSGSTVLNLYNPTRNDFNGDKKSDILWRNDDGRVAVWQMNGSTVTSGSTFATVSTSWKIAGTGDFTGDKKSDILWRNDDGSVALWQMDGQTILSQDYLNPYPTVDNSWKIAGTGDFGGDQKSDILWRNDNGQMAIWQMDGSKVVSSGLTSISSADLSWKVAGTGDFGGDGKLDILWRKNDGSVALWQMDGTNVLSQNYLNPYPTVDNSWKISGTGDFNGDSKADILWRNDDGSTSIWLMDGANVLSSGLVPQYPTVDNSWKISGTGDFNGDGKSDILWRNTNGSTSVWEMNGLNVIANNSTNPYPLTDNTWTIAAPIL